jgi:hypothetical protein
MTRETPMTILFPDKLTVCYWSHGHRQLIYPLKIRLDGGFKHFLFPFHIWDVILPIDYILVSYFSRWLLHHQPEGDFFHSFFGMFTRGYPSGDRFPRSQDQLSTVASSAALGELTLDQQAPGCPGKDVCLWNMWNIGQWMEHDGIPLGYIYIT